MLELVKLNPSHYEKLYEIAKVNDPTFDADSLDHFSAALTGLEGWTIQSDGEPIGAVLLSHFTPQLNVILHGFVRSDCRKRWLTRAMLREVYHYIFDELKVVRVSGFGIEGLTDVAQNFLVRMGFKRECGEGFCIRKGIRIRGEYMDVITYGMLREECRWLA